MTAPAHAHVRETTHRLIASRFPTVGVFDDLSNDKEEVGIAYLLESATNDRSSILSRRLPLLPESEIVQGPGATLVMASFLHADENGGRFTDGRLGAWYASLEIETGIAETVHHSTRRLRLSRGAFPSNIQMRELTAGVDCDLRDIRATRHQNPELYEPDDYSQSRLFGLALRWPKSGQPTNGIIFDSVRRDGGVNVCIYRPSLVLLPVNQADHYEYRWDAAGVVSVVRLTNVSPAER